MVYLPSYSLVFQRDRNTYNANMGLAYWYAFLHFNIPYLPAEEKGRGSEKNKDSVIIFLIKTE